MEEVTGDAPLAGVKVVEAATYVSAPFAGLMLAHLGAEVVKVEPPGGDPTRRFGHTQRGLSALFVNVSHGKRSVVLDLKEASGKDAMVEHLAGADVFLQNWRPGVAAALGLDFDDIAPLNPRLVYAAITGFGADGPRATRPAFDTSIQAATGLAAWESGAESPRPVRSAVADKSTASLAVQAILAALLRRERTGRGGRIDLSMTDALAYFSFPDVCQDRTFLPPAPPTDLAKPRSGMLPTSDGHVVVTPVTGRQIIGAITAVGHPEWKDLMKATTSTIELVDLIFDRLGSVTPSKTTAEWEAIFAQYDVPAIALVSIDEHLQEAEAAEGGPYSSVLTEAGPVRRIRYPALWGGRVLPPPGPPPSVAS